MESYLCMFRAYLQGELSWKYLLLTSFRSEPLLGTAHCTVCSSTLTLPGHLTFSFLDSFVIPTTKRPEQLSATHLHGHALQPPSQGKSFPAVTHLGPCQPLVPEVIVVTHSKFLASASTIVAEHLGIGFEDMIYHMQAVHTADLFPVLQGSPFWVEQVPIGIHN